jgi:hypothetical protein
MFTKTALFVDFKQKGGELILSITYYPSIIILENAVC